ncbi:ArsR family transcriptional regulator [Candidatus Thorarchaeota archaeon]|nr:MAG: ArsR family transcriptional regulator [Candidatus Thorarchaeota archaeon]
MTEDIDDIKRELDEVRRLKEELRREVEDVRREKADAIRREADEVRREVDRRRAQRPPRPPRAPHPPRRVRPVRDIDIDISGITDSLEDMMEGLGKSIEMSIKDVEGIGKSIRIPGVHIRRASRKGKKIRKSDIEKIPPERVAKIVAPLGSEERLKILEFLKEGGKTFNEIEIFTTKTGSSLTHHLNPLVEAGYVVKGEVRGTYYLTVEGRLAYRLAQWLTHRVEQQRDRVGSNGSHGEAEVSVDFDEDEDEDETIVVVEDEEALEKAAEHLERVQDDIEKMQDKLESAAEKIAETKEEELEAEEERLEALRELEDNEDGEDDLDAMDWED